MQDASDGAKAFIGILKEVMAGEPEVLLMDEPEAFLHPGLAFTLGREICNSAAGERKRIFVSTHSSSFLMGCVHSGVPISVIRLTYKDGIPTARMLESSELVKMMRNPLLRSAGVMGALFYESVVVTEADPDRAFYQEINDRLVSAGDARGIKNCAFLNAQNKQTIPTIIAPLRNLGIAAAGIYDVDFLKDGGLVATRYMDSAGIASISQNSISTLRAAVLKALEASGRNFKREGGIKLLNATDKGAAEELIHSFAEYGAFIIPNGELEVWLHDLKISGHGPSWLIPMFERMGDNPNSSNYVHPAEGDVWDFIGKVREWLDSPTRKGMRCTTAI